MTPETNALIPVGIAALCFLLAFLYGRHRRALALRRRVAESFGQTPAEPERPRAMTREFWELLRAGEPAGQCIDDATWNDLDMDDVFARIDICQSAVGRACLYAALHRLSSGPELGPARPPLRPFRGAARASAERPALPCTPGPQARAGIRRFPV